ncbi:MAG: ABC transporter ATP-binding protein [Dehalococcoidia bacterium]
MTDSDQLAIRGLTVDYGGAGGVRALENLDLTVETGSFHALLGPSGCGKSTLIKVLAGLVRRSGGVFSLPGDGTVAYVPQGNSCFPWLRAEENVGYGLRLRGVGKDERLRRSRSLLRSLGLEQFARAFPAQLSEGMRQRVAIARAFAVESPVLLMDEPLSALDFQTKAGVQSELMQLWAERRCTVLYVTHDIDEALTLADRVSVLSARPGRIALAEEVPFPRPRNHATLREQPGYGALFRKLYEALEA